MAITSTILAQFDAVQTGANDFAADKFVPKMQYLQKTTDGTTANKADMLWMDQRVITTGANDDIDLAGVLTDVFGTTITMAEVVLLFLINAPRSGSANTTDLTIGIGSNPFLGFLGGTTPTIGPIKPGGMIMIGAGDAAGIGTVTAGTADILRVANSAGASATYQIAILARSA